MDINMEQVIVAIGAICFILIILYRLFRSGDYLDEQLRLVKKGEIHAQPLMNRAEMRLFIQLGKWKAQPAQQKLQLFPQVALGEILASEKENTRRSYNAKRLDFLFVDQEGLPKIAVEYQGEGHYGDTAQQKKQAKKRDKIKRLALEKAGVELVEIFHDESWNDIQAKLNSACDVIHLN